MFVPQTTRGFMGAISGMHSDAGERAQAAMRKAEYARELQMQMTEKQGRRGGAPRGQSLMPPHSYDDSSMHYGRGYAAQQGFSENQLNRALGSTLANDLQQQMQEKRDREHRERSLREAEDRKFATSSDDFFRFGRGGAGAPLRDANGAVVTQLKQFMHGGSQPLSQDYSAPQQAPAPPQQSMAYQPPGPRYHQPFSQPPSLQYPPAEAWQQQPQQQQPRLQQQQQQQQRFEPQPPQQQQQPQQQAYVRGAMFRAVQDDQSTARARAREQHNMELAEQIAQKKRQQEEEKARIAAQDLAEAAKLQRDQEELAERHRQELAEKKEKALKGKGPSTGGGGIDIKEPPPRAQRQRKMRSPPPSPPPAVQQLPTRPRVQSPPIPTMRGQMPVRPPTPPQQQPQPSSAPASQRGRRPLISSDGSDTQQPLSQPQPQPPLQQEQHLPQAPYDQAQFSQPPFAGRRAEGGDRSYGLESLRMEMELAQRRTAEQLAAQDRQVALLRQVQANWNAGARIPVGLASAGLGDLLNSTAAQMPAASQQAQFIQQSQFVLPLPPMQMLQQLQQQQALKQPQQLTTAVPSASASEPPSAPVQSADVLTIAPAVAAPPVSSTTYVPSASGSSAYERRMSRLDIAVQRRDVPRPESVDFDLRSESMLIRPTSQQSMRSSTGFRVETTFVLPLGMKPTLSYSSAISEPLDTHASRARADTGTSQVVPLLPPSGKPPRSPIGRRLVSSQSRVERQKTLTDFLEKGIPAT